MPRKTIRKRSNKRTTKKSFKQMNCNPLVDGKTAVSSSCLTPESLLKIKYEYNRTHPNNTIESKDSRKLYSDLKERLAHCDKEDCWLEQIQDKQLRDTIDNLSFAPDQPEEWKSNPDEWLSNFDIFNVIYQYEQKHDEFKFFGPTSIDFDTKLPQKGGKCVEDELCHFSLKYWMGKGKTKFGIVFNLDKHDEPGSHWVSMFIDTVNKFVFYFDSAGASSVPPEIDAFAKKVIEQGKENKIKFKYFHNKGIQHQKGNTECGMYSLFFIITMLTGKVPMLKKKVPIKKRIKLFLKLKIPDEIVFDYRELYFNEKD